MNVINCESKNIRINKMYLFLFSCEWMCMYTKNEVNIFITNDMLVLRKAIGRAIQIYKNIYLELKNKQIIRVVNHTWTLYIL